MLTVIQEDIIKNVIELSDEQINLLQKNKRIYTYKDKTVYKVYLIHDAYIKDILASKSFNIGPNINTDPTDVFIVYTAPTPEIYHVNRKLFYWTWTIYNLNTGEVIFMTDNRKTPDITSTMGRK